MNELLIVMEIIVACFAFIISIIVIIVLVLEEIYLSKRGGDPYGNGWKVDYGKNGELPKIK